MCHTIYDVRMHTPLGDRLGEMTVLRDNDRLSGSLSILGHNEPFVGVVDAYGNCALSGKIITLMRTIRFAAAGKMTENGFTLSIPDGNHILNLIATVRKGGN
ncbi:MAG: hypothetical protein ACI3XM_04575 [Eubacteriales bacterium]